MIPIEMIKKNLPDDIKVINYGDKIDVNNFICQFPEKYLIDGAEKQTSFAVCFYVPDIVGKSEKDIDELVSGRCRIGYEVGLKHHQKYVNRDK